MATTTHKLPGHGRQPSVANQSTYHPVEECDVSDSGTTATNDSDPDIPRPPLKRKWLVGLLLCASGVALALVAHIILTVKLAAKAAARGYGWGSTTSVVYEGSCHSANRMATGLHFLINVIVLTLTSTSSYCCQILAAPSRGGIDRAHSQRVWVSIGSSSFTNVWYAPIWRKTLWLLILGTSWPVQMM